MEIRFCPQCQVELKAIYKNAYKDGDEYRTMAGVRAKPAEFLCEACEAIFTIEKIGIIS